MTKILTEEQLDDLSREMVKGGKSVNWLASKIEAAVLEAQAGQKPVGEFGEHSFLWNDAKFPLNAPVRTKLYAAPVVQPAELATCESCGESYPIDQVQNEDVSGGGMCDKCCIASLKDRLKALSMAVMADNSYHDKVAVVQPGMVEKLIECRSSVRSDLTAYEKMIVAKEKLGEQETPSYDAANAEANRLSDLLDYIDMIAAAEGKQTK